MPDRYSRNKELISADNQKLISKKTIAVVGLGGLGGHIAEQLARLGFGKLILIDSDNIDNSNLNRQLFSTEATLNKPKTEAALERLALVNSDVEYVAHNARFDIENGAALLDGTDVIVDAVDNIPTRIVLGEICDAMNIPLVHGSIGGWWGQVSTIFPGDKTMSRLYPHPNEPGIEKHYGNPAFTPAIVASIQVAEVLKVCLGKSQVLRGKLLRIDLLEHEYFVIDVL